MTLADRMIVMNAGRADQIGAPLEVYANPQTEFVAGFIGSPPMNFLPAGMAAQAPGDAKTLGIRPEHLRIGQTGAEATAIYNEALGAETLVHVHLAQGRQVTVRQDAAAPLPEEGAEVHLEWNAQDQIFFLTRKAGDADHCGNV